MGHTVALSAIGQRHRAGHRQAARFHTVCLNYSTTCRDCRTRLRGTAAFDPARAGSCLAMSANRAKYFRGIDR